MLKLQPVNQNNKKNKNPFSNDGSIDYNKIRDTFENTVKIQVKEGVHQ